MANIQQKYEKRNEKYQTFCKNMDNGKFSRFQMKVVFPIVKRRFMELHEAGMKELPTFKGMNGLKMEKCDLNKKLNTAEEQIGLLTERLELKKEENAQLREKIGELLKMRADNENAKNSHSH